ncbi:MAG: hypothetical protein M3R64_06485 [Pseudomonadota bacterium]|nr:hypothetical protein [Pseudomonadota bacterium]
MLRPILFAVLMTAPGLATAQSVPAADPPQRIRSVTLTPGQSCPKGSDDEIVVCSTLDQPYRIPKRLRDTGPIAAKNQSWVNRAATTDQVSRVAGGLPDTCSPIGSSGGTGCALQANQQWAAEQRAKRSGSPDVPQ